MSEQTIKSTGCCEPFNPEPWQEKEIVWQDKIFVKDHVISFLHIPLNFGRIVVKNMALIEKANAKAPYQLMLTDEKSNLCDNLGCGDHRRRLCGLGV